MPNTVRFLVSRADVNVLLAELSDHHPEGLYAPLLEALLAAVARLDTSAARLDTGRAQTTDLMLADRYGEPFHEWLERAALRESTAGNPAKAQVFARVRDSGQ
jgi:hypothetical protein